MGTCSAIQKKKLSEPFEPPQAPDSDYLLSEINLSQYAFSKIPWRIQFNASNIRNSNEDNLNPNQMFEIADPELQCNSMNRAAYICLSKACIDSQHFLRCDKRFCPSCSKEHQFHANKFHLEELTKQLRLRAAEQSRLFNQMEEIEAKLINDIVIKKLASFDKFSTRALDRRYGRIIQAIYITKNKKDIDGGLINELTDILSQINDKLSKHATGLISRFEAEALKIAESWQKLELSIIQEFLQYPKPTTSSLQTSSSLPQKAHQSFPYLNQPINPHNNSFDTMASNTITVTYVEPDNQWRSFIKIDPIPRNSTTVYAIKQVNTKYSKIFTGIATRAIFGVNNPFKNREALTYSSQTGYVYENGQGLKKGRKVMQGETINLEVNTNKAAVCWKMGELQVSAPIPQPLRRQPLFLVIMMCTENDSVELHFE